MVSLCNAYDRLVLVLYMTNHYTSLDYDETMRKWLKMREIKQYYKKVCR